MSAPLRAVNLEPDMDDAGIEDVEPFPSARQHFDKNYPSPQGLSATIEEHLAHYFASHGHDMPSAGLYDRVLQEMERPLLSLTLGLCNGNQLRAAELLGLNRNTLRKKMRELGIVKTPRRRLMSD